MKLIEALKAVKELQRKAEDLRRKIALYCAHTNIEKSTYENQTEKISEWLQGHSDLLKEILKLRLAIQYTNLVAECSIDIGGKTVHKSIAAWIHRRRDLADFEKEAWERLSDRGLKTGFLPSSQGAEPQKIEPVRHYNQEERDRHVDMFAEEPHLIDSRLEVVNATTELVYPSVV